MASTFLTLLGKIGAFGAFWIYAIVGILGLGFCFFYVPETKGRSLEDIEKYFSQRKL